MTPHDPCELIAVETCPEAKLTARLNWLATFRKIVSVYVGQPSERTMGACSSHSSPAEYKIIHQKRSS